jgi:hypothetical protein
MKRIGIVGLCFAAIFALSAMAASSAYAGEYGVCKELTKETTPKAKHGKYEEMKCVKLYEKGGKAVAKGSFEWFPGSPDCVKVKKGGEFTNADCTDLASKDGKGKYETETFWVVNDKELASSEQAPAKSVNKWYITFQQGGETILVECNVLTEKLIYTRHGTYAEIETEGPCNELKPMKTRTWTFKKVQIKVNAGAMAPDLARPPSVSPEQAVASSGETFAACAPPGFWKMVNGSDAEACGDILKGLEIELQPMEGGERCKIKGDLVGEFNSETTTLEFPEDPVSDTSLKGTGCSSVVISGEDKITLTEGGTLQLAVPPDYEKGM